MTTYSVSGQMSNILTNLPETLYCDITKGEGLSRGNYFLSDIATYEIIMCPKLGRKSMYTL